MDLLLWTGPVSTSNLNGINWVNPTKIITINQGIGGIGSSHFSALGQSLGSNPVQAILAQYGLSAGDFEHIGIAGFSAAHGLISHVLKSEDAGLIDFVGAFDAYYTGHDKTIKPGYLNFAKRAESGAVTMVMTSSGFAGPGYPSGADSVRPMIESLQLFPVNVPSGVPVPQEALGKGGFIWANYGTSFQHVDHVHKLLVPWMNAIGAKGLAGQSPGAGIFGNPADSSALVFVGIAAAAALGTWWYMKSSRR